MNLAFAPLGVLFQEFHTPVYQKSFDALRVASLLRQVWIVCSFLLVMAFAGNLKAVFVIRNFEDAPETIEEISDRCRKA